MAPDSFSEIFERLRDILRPFEKQCEVQKDTAADYYLDCRHLGRNGKPVFFGGVSVNKATVSFYLMPVHANPELVRRASAELRAHQHGNCCFRFNRIDPGLIQELKALTQKCFAQTKADKHLL